jgi:hypothetical protein
MALLRRLPFLPHLAIKTVISIFSLFLSVLRYALEKERADKAAAAA